MYLVRCRRPVGLIGRHFGLTARRIVTNEVIKETSGGRFNVLVHDDRGLINERLRVLVRRRLTMLRVVGINASLVRTMNEISDRCVIRAKFAGDARRRVSDFIATVPWRSKVKARLFGFERFYLWLPLRKIKVAIIQRIVEVLIYVRGGKYHDAVVFVAY